MFYQLCAYKLIKRIKGWIDYHIKAGSNVPLCFLYQKQIDSDLLIIMKMYKVTVIMHTHRLNN